MNVTRKQVERELEKLIRGAANIADTHFGQGAGAAMLGVKEMPDDWEDAQVEVTHFPIHHTLMHLYGYAVEAVGDGNEIDWLHELDDFVSGISQSPLMHATPEFCQQVLDVAIARWKLDSNEDDLTIRELALLARLDERSVRNAASKNEFKTKKSGNQVFIEPDEASAWLSNRRNFQATHFKVHGSKQPAEIRLATIELTDGNLRNAHLYLESVMHLFPDDVIGGKNKAERAAREMTVDYGFDEPVVTDIAGDKKIFRSRGWLAEFFKRHHFVAGDRVVIERVDDYKYHLYPARG
ncbi:MAG: helix-turn-helix domain-containing protein [Gammaproteobacteria bacterium]